VDDEDERQVASLVPERYAVLMPGANWETGDFSYLKPYYVRALDLQKAKAQVDFGTETTNKLTYQAQFGKQSAAAIGMIQGLTGRQSVLWAASLLPFSQLPYLFSLTGVAYAIGALVLGIGQLAIAFRFARHRSIANARTLFLASIIYLPLLWALMVVTRK